MSFLIRERFRPYSHLAGASTPLPGSFYEVQVFPCLIRFYSLQAVIPVFLDEVALNLRGPVDSFTLTNDLERGRITVTGCSTEGWFCYHLISAQQGEAVSFLVERASSMGIAITYQKKDYLLHKGEGIEFFSQEEPFTSYSPSFRERLSLGSHKKQEWEGMYRRLNLSELLPFWHRLGLSMPSFPPPTKKEGTLALLKTCRQTFLDRDPVRTEESFRQLLRVGFRGMGTPCLKDFFYQGILFDHPVQDFTISPLVLLTEGARLIRELFVVQQGEKIEILPHLLPSLHCGHFIEIPFEGGTLSLEWTKKTIRRLMIHVNEERETQICFRSSVSSYRLRQSKQEKGERKKNGSSLFLKKNSDYTFDNFQ